MEKIWNWIKNVELLDVGAFILFIGVTIIALSCVMFIWDTKEVFALKLGLTGIITGICGLFIMLAGL